MVSWRVRCLVIAFAFVRLLVATASADRLQRTCEKALAAVTSQPGESGQTHRLKNPEDRLRHQLATQLESWLRQHPDKTVRSRHFVDEILLEVDSSLSSHFAAFVANRKTGPRDQKGRFRDELVRLSEEILLSSERLLTLDHRNSPEWSGLLKEAGSRSERVFFIEIIQRVKASPRLPQSVDLPLLVSSVRNASHQTWHAYQRASEGASSMQKKNLRDQEVRRAVQAALANINAASRGLAIPQASPLVSGRYLQGMMNQFDRLTAPWAQRSREQVRKEFEMTLRRLGQNPPVQPIKFVKDFLTASQAKQHADAESLGPLGTLILRYPAVEARDALINLLHRATRKLDLEWERRGSDPEMRALIVQQVVTKLQTWLTSHLIDLPQLSENQINTQILSPTFASLDWNILPSLTPQDSNESIQKKIEHLEWRALALILHDRSSLTKLMHLLKNQSKDVHPWSSDSPTMTEKEQAELTLEIQRTYSSRLFTPAAVQRLVHRLRAYPWSRIFWRQNFLTADAPSHESRQELHRIRTRAQTLTDELVLRNVGLAGRVAKAYQTKGLPWEDLKQAGVMGLIQGLQRFESQRGLKLSTYLVWAIRGEISRLKEKNNRWQSIRSLQQPLARDGMTLGDVLDEEDARRDRRHHRPAPPKNLADSKTDRPERVSHAVESDAQARP